MLASKSSCKDRWRQVLAEAARVKRKHLLTLEPAISTHQTNEMENYNLQLVVPRKVMPTYTTNQQRWLMDIGSYISFVRANNS
ncbi:Type-2 restriction enzyme EcoRII [compost metagenome]